MMQLPSIIKSIYRPDRSPSSLLKRTDTSALKSHESLMTSQTLLTSSQNSLKSSRESLEVQKINRNRATSLKIHPGHNANGGHIGSPLSPVADHLAVSPRTKRRWNSLRRSKKKSPMVSKKVVKAIILKYINIL